MEKEKIERCSWATTDLYKEYHDSVRLNHAIADGYLVAKVFKLLEDEISIFCNDQKG